MQMAFVTYEDSEVLEKVLNIKEMQIEGCRVNLIRAEKKRGDTRGSDRERDDAFLQLPSSSAPGTPAAALPPPPRWSEVAGVAELAPPSARSPGRGRRSPPRAGRGGGGVGGGGWDDRPTLGKRDRVPEGANAGDANALDDDDAPAVGENRAPPDDNRAPPPLCGVGMTLDPATAWSNNCCVVREVKKGGPVDVSGKVRVGHRLVQVNHVSCVGMTRDVIKTYVVGPVGSKVELIFASGDSDKETITVRLERFVPPKLPPTPSATSAVTLGGEGDAQDMHKRQRVEPAIVARAAELPPPISPAASAFDPNPPAAAWDRTERDNRGDWGQRVDRLPPNNVPPHLRPPFRVDEREVPAGGGRGGWDRDSGDVRHGDAWRDSGRDAGWDAARGHGREMLNERDRMDRESMDRESMDRERADASRYSQRDARDQWVPPPAPPPPGGWGGGRDDRGPTARDERGFGGRNDGGFCGRDVGMHDQRHAGAAMARDSPRDNARDFGQGGGLSPQRAHGAPYDRAPPGAWNRRSRSPPPIAGGGRGHLGPAPLIPSRLQEHRIFLTATTGGLRWLNQDAIHSAMSKFGQVLQVFIPLGKKFAYVSYDTGDAKEAALRQRDLVFLGCNVRVDVAKVQGASAADRDGPRGPPAPFGTDRPHWRDTDGRDGRDTRQMPGGSRGNGDIRDARRLFSCAKDVQHSYNSNSRNRHSSHSFSYCNSLDSSVARRWGASELTLNFTAGDSDQHLEPQRLLTRKHGADSFFSQGWQDYEGASREDASREVASRAVASRVGSRALGGKSTREGQEGSDRRDDHLVSNRRDDHHIRERRDTGICTCLIKTHMNGESLQQVMELVERNAFDLSLEDVAQCLVRYACLLLPHQAVHTPSSNAAQQADASHVSHVSQSSHDSSSGKEAKKEQVQMQMQEAGCDESNHLQVAHALLLLQHCLPLVPYLARRFVALSGNDGVDSLRCGAAGADVQSASSKPLSNLDSTHAFSRAAPNSVDGNVNNAADSAAAAAPPTKQAPHNVLDGQVVRRVFSAVTQVYQAAVLVQHLYGEETHGVAQQVCATCRDTLARMVQSVTCHLEASVLHKKDALDAHNVEVGTGDVIEVLGAIAQVADSVRCVARDTLNHQGIHDVQSLAHTMCTIGHWLVLFLVPPQAAPHADAVGDMHTAHVSGGLSGGLSILTKHQSVSLVSSFAQVGSLPPPHVAVLLLLPLLPQSEKEDEMASYRREVLDFVAALDARHVHKLLTAVPKVVSRSLFTRMCQ